MAKLVKLKQRTPEWHAWRKGKISASMIPTIMGFNPYQTPLQLYEQLMNEEEVPVNAAMERGIELEGKARIWAENKLNCSYPEACLEHDLYNFHIASLDGFNLDGQVKAIEIKCPGKQNHDVAKLGVVPPQYYPQLQWQMYVAGIDKMYYISFDGDDGEIIEVHRDDRLIDKARAIANDFRTCLVEYLPPEPCDRDLIQVNDPEAIFIARELADVDTEIRKLEQEKEKLKTRLIEKVGYQSSKVGEFRLVRYTRRGTVEYTKIPELANVDLEKYRKKPIQSWRFTA